MHTPRSPTCWRLTRGVASLNSASDFQDSDRSDPPGVVGASHVLRVAVAVQEHVLHALQKEANQQHEIQRELHEHVETQKEAEADQEDENLLSEVALALVERSVVYMSEDKEHMQRVEHDDYAEAD